MDQCGSPFFGALDALAVDDCRRRTGLATGQLTETNLKRVMNATKRAVIVPAAQISQTWRACRLIGKGGSDLSEPCALFGNAEPAQFTVTLAAAE